MIDGKNLKTRNKSMLAFGEKFAKPSVQLSVLNDSNGFAKFDDKISQLGLYPLTTTGIEIFQVNIGKMCNQVCKHCHVDAGPDRKEIMTKETMQDCLNVLMSSDIKTVDITGGAPEMNPNFKWFISELKKMEKHVIVRSNLTILVANGFHDFANFFAEKEIEVVSSLPHYTGSGTDKQRGEGVFEKSIRAIQLLNQLGYGVENSNLILNLVYNPVGAFLPPSQHSLEKDYKRELDRKFGIKFNSLYTITNMPISRYLDYLITSGNYETYMEKLISAFNPVAAANVMCRNTISVSWNGFLYDCDFNQMLELKVNHSAPNHIPDFNFERLKNRIIVTGQHCYGCTAGSGSSCGGSLV